jgi:hypothetical protein
MFDFWALVSGGLSLANQVLSATVVLTAFSLLVYLLTHSFRSPVARAFCALLVCVLIVYSGDVVLAEASPSSVEAWLRFQWIGIAFAPAAYLHFSDELIRLTNVRARRIAVLASYGLSLAFLGLVFSTELLVHDGIFVPQQSHLAAGPMFWVFALYFFVALAWGVANVARARQRCLTRASRRRMTYLGLALAGPALGIFPYMLLTSLPLRLPHDFFSVLLLVGNVAVLTMIVVLTYSVAYFGALAPDRVIKHSLIHYLLRGPFVGAVIIFTVLIIPRVQRILGLPRDTVLIFAVVGVTVLLQMLINLAKPLIDRIIYREDREEVAWIQTLDRRLLTTADLQSFLENTIAALCDLLRVRTAFVGVPVGDEYRLEAVCGDRSLVQRFVGQQGAALLPTSSDDHGAPFIASDRFWLVPLSSQNGDVRLGVLGVEARAPQPEMAVEEQKIADLLIHRAREVLEDRYLQQNVFQMLRTILPDIERLHRWRQATRYAGTPSVTIESDNPIYSPEFQQWVKDALSHYWGGPKLTESPLLSMEVVKTALQRNGGSPGYALRSVLAEAIERLRPSGERKMTTAEWILYNILEMRFLRGLKVKDIAGRLAMSESDLYRKQRVAISQVANVLAELEQNELVPGRQPAPGPAKALRPGGEPGQNGDRGDEAAAGARLS